MDLTRRGFVAVTALEIGLASVATRASGMVLAVDSLRVESVERPLGVDDLAPRLSWRMSSPTRNASQSTYRIFVATTLDGLQAGRADLWDSGSIKSSQSFGISYEGRALTSGQRCFWAVEVHDDQGLIARSQPSWWEMGLLTPDAWRAAWINVEDESGKAFREANAGKSLYGYPVQPAMLLRRRFAVTKPVASARLYATALGAYEARINGRAASDRKLAPELTDYRKRVLYQVYDVTNLISQGENVMAGLVGDGWYASPFSYTPVPYMFGPPPRRFLAQLELRYADGTKDVIGTDEAWRIATSPIASSQIYDGENYDARNELLGWDAAGFDDSAWRPIEVGQVPPARLVAQIDAPIRAIRTLAPVKITNPRAGAYVFDFGQNFAGWAKLTVAGSVGTAITMRFAEVLKPSGEIDQSNLRTAKATDTFILRGDPKGESFEPHFTYHGFRYVEVTGFPGTPSINNLVGVVANTDLPETGALRNGNPVLQQFWQNSLWSQRANFFGIPTDCPQRDERMGWMGDAQVFWDAASYNMDTDVFTNRFMDDVRDVQNAKGAFADVVPYPSASYGSPGWADGGVILPWTAYTHFGDSRIIDRNWDAMKRWIDYVLQANPDFIWRNNRGQDYGDWLAVDAKQPGDPTTPKDLIGTAFWAHSTGLMANMANATNRTDDYAYFSKLEARIRSAFCGSFVRHDGSIGNDSQTSYILPLAFDLLPVTMKRPAADRLAANIRKRGTHLSTGFLGTPYVLDALASNGHEDLAIELIMQTTYPSWGYMVMQGATTTWERWNANTGDVSMNSFNHYAFGAVVGFMYRRLAGIAPGKPGFKEIVVRPICDKRLKFGGGSYDFVVGKISTDWRWQGNRLELDVIIPANATATIFVPASSGQEVREGGRKIKGHRDVRFVSRTDTHCVLSVGSGTYAFLV